MTRSGTFVLCAVGAGVAAVYLLPPHWLAPLSAGVAVCAFVFALIARFQTRTDPPANPLAGVLLSVLNIPGQPFAKVKEGWTLTAFLVAVAFLVALGLAVMVRAHA